ncbi:hypothetical protein E8E13_006940 [Curvularia kusanoi]|uniref:Pisatin demethylase n=1 Tax=Curvularia kusanoi TaxID=90978 RepID=A0A9P4TBI4_CURKU|nr:hypothetical protein E8E13_006940 [Curvularia kusanoi]
MTASPHVLHQPTSNITNGLYYIYGAIALITFGLVKYVYQTLNSPLRNVPGPMLARFTRLWELQSIRNQDNPTFNIALHEKYGKMLQASSNIDAKATHRPLTKKGPVVRLAPNRYSINDADAAKVILGHHNAMEKSRYYVPFATAGQHNMFSEPALAAHAKLRRPIAQLYSQTNLLSYEPFVDTCNAILIKRLEEYAQNGKTLDVRKLLQFYAFDVIGEITTGSRFGLMEDDGDRSGITSAIDGSLVYAALIGLIPEWHWWISKMADILGQKSDIGKMFDFVGRHLDDRISGRTKLPDDRSDFIDKLLSMEQDGKAERIHTLTATFHNIAAGSDTTAISLTSALAHLTMYPNTLATLRRELDEATVSGNLSDPVTFQQAQKLPYLQACIMEAMRVHPAVAAPMARVVGSQGLQIASTFFPPGTEVGVNAWVIHNNKSIFGPDAHVFRPERWLTDSKEERAVLDRNFLAFGNGPRTCIGKNISLMEMSKVIPQIVRKYDFEIVPDGEGRRYSWTTRWFAKPNFKAVVSRRVQKAE